MRFSERLFLVTLCVLAPVLLAHGDEPAAVPAQLPASIQIRNVRFDLLLRPRDASSADGTPLVLYAAQPWKCMTWTVKAPGGDGLAASLKNRFTSKTFARAEGDVVRQIPFRADKLWKFEKLADGQWRIVDPEDGKAVTARDAQTVVLEEWKDAPGQRWEILPAPEHLTM